MLTLHVSRPTHLLACLLLGWLIHTTPVSAANAQAATEALHTWLDSQYEQELKFSPIKLTTLGRRQLYDQIDDFSAAADQRLLRWFRDSVDQLRQRFDYDALTLEGQISWDFWVYRLQQMEQANTYRRQQYVFTPQSTPHTNLPKLLINYHRVDSAQDMEAYISRLQGTARALRQLQQRAMAAAADDIRPPRFAYDTVLEQARGIITGAPFTNGDDSALWADIKAKLAALQQEGGIEPGAATALQQRARAALLGEFREAYRELIDWLQQDRANAAAEAQGVHTLPDGEAYYNERLRHFTTLDMAADQIHELGLAEVARIQQAMQAVMTQVGFAGTLAEFFDFVRDDEQFYYPDTDAGREAFIAETEQYLARIESQLPLYFGMLPEAPLVVKRVEAFRERAGGSAFYEEGTADGSRPGVYYMHLSDMRANNRSDLQTTAYHEGSPGHHMQLSIALESTTLPLFRRHVWYSAYGEGWALYAERVAGEMGVYDNPYYDFGRLSAEIFRAIRLVVDTGMHARGWSEERAVQYMLDNSPIPEPSVRSEIQRYLVWPGQAVSYKIGMQKILELRETARRELGENFDIRGFHDTVLGSGSLPLTILERRIEAWIANQQPH